ncbi:MULTISPECIES: UDP-N-acetylglucosamine 1-carboxyvinyltransferase [Actinotignum]|uniref:UDP-N-acetylglucosamine 1-carboxyvinyltransferase n=4 Tax=Actinotignum TaxID=1653174 RepID=A0AAW9HBX8_9ACTO|nr:MULTISPECIES: UDP-N-acetylglucosamine 1-carboxyvinyltransferase [Actinotignum]MBS5749257.1 UDP-N-acetylglucosamine 1-carboxyvinyltransferase [Actinotignum schaalii]MDE1536054.1 UDP-N-acetylglucosamine 1-carboxyvinyltransferase [Actinotignum schaalii]MDE1557792.1 UDP-N-acetylglucosamine 1-carboxyvinyltransferase [Actinotignum schaalii]MDE1663708.1 UDP-N-acetylglucosamine 1-carboxyvinyltransferase [Actinotignum schaalii]MDK6591047.1 UDP-N-acetylglucosamine 1-carboxyvinyltransferase [Actinotig
MVSQLVVRGGVPLSGEITVRGAKNFVSKSMVASLLTKETSVLRNVPQIRDVTVVSELLGLHGVEVNYQPEAGTVEITPGDIHLPHDPHEVNALAGSSRIPILFAGPLLHRLGEAYIPDLGGCHIGSRPVDFHLRVLEEFGAKRVQEETGMHLVAPKGLRAKPVRLPYPSVGATEQTLLTAVMAEGVTELSNAAVEPEIMDLIAVLQKMGAIISVDTDRVIRVEGVDELVGYSHTSLPDRIEAGSWAAAALATGGDIFVRGAEQQSMTSFLNLFRKVGGKFDVRDDGIRFWHPGGALQSVSFETDVHPGFMTDWQQPLVVALTQAEGMSIVHETVYENRFGFTEALRDMGANIQTYRECLGGHECRFGQRNFYHSAVIQGPTPLRATDIVVPDLRGGFSHLIAALAAEGESRVSGVDIIDRGYEKFLDKLQALGADVTPLDA